MLETMFSVWQNRERWGNMHSYARAVNVSGNMLPRFIETDARKNSSRKAPAESNDDDMKNVTIFFSTFRACQSCMAAIG